MDDLDAFCRWNSGHLLENRTRGAYAEWLVHRALNLDPGEHRVEWAEVDVRAGELTLRLYEDCAGLLAAALAVRGLMASGQLAADPLRGPLAARHGLGLDLPVLVQTSGTAPDSPSGAGLGDLRIVPRFDLLRTEHLGLGLLLDGGGSFARLSGEARDDWRLFLLGSTLGHIAHQRGLFPLHAACLRIGGRAVAITAMRWARWLRPAGEPAATSTDGRSTGTSVPSRISAERTPLWLVS